MSAGMADLDPTRWPRRARVAFQAPIGIGTPWVESLSGLVMRSAWALELPVGRLLTRVAAEAVDLPIAGAAHADEVARYLGSVLKGGTAAVNADTGSARVMAQVLGNVSLQPRLAELTLTAWDHRVGGSGVLSGERRSCPACLWEWRQDGRPVYEPLLWQFHALGACVRHRVRLRSACPDPACGRVRKTLAGWGGVGVCVGCAGSIARPPGSLVDEEPLTEAEVDWAAFVERELGAVLASPPGPGPTDGRSFPSVLRLAIDRVADGSQARFARAIAMTEATVSYWLDDHRLPSLEGCLRVSRATGFPLRAMIVGDLDALRATEPPTSLPAVPDARRGHPAKDRGDVARILAAAMVADPPPTLRSLGQEHGLDSSWLRREYPQERRAIRERWERYKTACKTERRAGRDECIREAVRSLTRDGIYPSRNQTMQRSGLDIFPADVPAWHSEVVRQGWPAPEELGLRKGVPMVVPSTGDVSYRPDHTRKDRRRS